MLFDIIKTGEIVRLVEINYNLKMTVHTTSYIIFFKSHFCDFLFKIFIREYSWRLD